MHQQCWKWSNVNGIRNVGLQRSLGTQIPAMPDTETWMLRYPVEAWAIPQALTLNISLQLGPSLLLDKVNFSESVHNLFRVSLCDGNQRQITFAWNVWHQKVTTTSWMEESLWHQGFLGRKIFKFSLDCKMQLWKGRRRIKWNSRRRSRNRRGQRRKGVGAGKETEEEKKHVWYQVFLQAMTVVTVSPAVNSNTYLQIEIQLCTSVT